MWDGYKVCNIEQGARTTFKSVIWSSSRKIIRPGQFYTRNRCIYRKYMPILVSRYHLEITGRGGSPSKAALPSPFFILDHHGLTPVPAHI